MTPQQQNFIRDYLKHIINGDAAIFAGAGLSMGSGFVNWRELLAEIAEDIGLKVDKEYDLISLAQFHVNEKGGRGKLNQKIINEFTEKTELNPNHRILSSLPIQTFWTVNYDSLIEDALKDALKRVDVKHTPSQLATQIFKRDAVVYKMHGDAQNPAKAIITKDDYEKYYKEYEGFITALSSDVISKTFLFIGFSFTDPNLDYILSRVRLSLDNNTRPHYCMIKQVSRDDKNCSTDADFEYNSRRQQLMISDLGRFQIEAILVKDYPEITKILKELENRYKRNTVFISGSAVSYAPHNEQESLEFVHELSKELIKKKYSVVNGFGENIGSAVINGALEAIYSAPQKYSESQLIMRPFPQVKTGNKEIEELRQEYRERIISFAGIAIFIFGNKKSSDTDQMIDADGVEKEFNIAISKGVIPIPIGATGTMSKTLWHKIKEHFEDYYGDFPDLKKDFLALGDTRKTLKELIQITLSIIGTINQK